MHHLEPPLRLKNQRDINSQNQIGNSLKELKRGYFYHGRRIGKSKSIDLNVCTFIIDSDDKLYVRTCAYSGDRSKWKEVIKLQLVKHLQDIGVEAGIAKAETRYFEVSAEDHVAIEVYEKKVLDLIANINR